MTKRSWFLCAVLLLLVWVGYGCSGELDAINSIRQSYPNGVIYQIDSDEYIVVDKNKPEVITYIIMTNIQRKILEERELKQVIGYKDVENTN